MLWVIFLLCLMGSSLSISLVIHGFREVDVVVLSFGIVAWLFFSIVTIKYTPIG